MGDPVVFVIRNNVKPGSEAAFREHYLSSIPGTESDKPGTIAQLAYSTDSSEVVIVRVFPSADDLDRHLEGADRRSKAAYEFIEPVAIELYGSPNPYATEMMAAVAPNIDVAVIPTYLGGFLRS